MVPEGMVREAWLRAEALCECRKAAHGHPEHCNQFLIWTERGRREGEAGRRAAAMIPACPAVRSCALPAMRRPQGECRAQQHRTGVQRTANDGSAPRKVTRTRLRAFWPGSAARKPNAAQRAHARRVHPNLRLSSGGGSMVHRAAACRRITRGASIVRRATHRVRT